MNDPSTNQSAANPQENSHQTLSRRDALKALVAATGATALSVLPNKWETPAVEIGALPAFAQASPTATPAPEVTVTPPPLGNEFAVMGTVGDGNLIVVFPTANTGLPTPTQNNVPGLPAGARPHGVAYFGEAGGLVSDFGNSRIFVVNLKTNALLATISTSANGYNGMGTIAVAPGSEYALACGRNSTLLILRRPFNTGPQITSLTLPGFIATYQTQAIVFDNNKRAFVYHTTGISVLRPPYTAIDFTIPFDNENTGTIASGAIAITPDGNTLLTTTFDPNVYVFRAPFSASTVPEILGVGSGGPLQTKFGLISEEITPLPASFNQAELLQGEQFDGINITPDGTKALVCTGLTNGHIFAISAPFSSSSTVEEIPLPAGLSRHFEDIGISPDGRLAVVTGNSSGNGAPAAFIRAPFTAARAQVFAVNILGGGRGAGAVRFQPSNT